ncbi:FMN-binding negative transcriptional regulator [Salinibacterium sp. SYSU T00001]|uniref:FMN-binding negative transcriptional regulator n=1 Tax=Homoserinimonas sedimenticola TaxID=2986805 RepID=UPI002236166B|nr:FMN-binding negative transcriptional regulator [Salinibacterium sedimenticola]MCW4385363.1 FMN-binding negative transcriptional regulator [Salinibacterium sedimenticola]
MRPNPDYQLDDIERIKTLIRDHPWVTFVSSVPGRGLVASHYPVILDEEAEGLVLLSHVGRPDEREHELGQHELLAIVQGPHGYISPGWYETSPAVPTWNFVTAHLHGRPQLLSDEENLGVLEKLVDHFERVLPEPFLMNRTLENADYAQRIVGGTVGFRLEVTRIEAKEKMSQDKPRDVVENVIDRLSSEGPYRNPQLARRMADVHARLAEAAR